MQEHSILSKVFLGYSPMIDRQRAVIATRLTIFPERPDADIDAHALLAALAELSPPGKSGEEPAAGPTLSLNLRPLDPAAVKARAASAALPPMSLNVAGETLLHGVMSAQPGPHLMVEVPAFMATDTKNAAMLQALQAAGSTLLIKGRPVAELPQSVLACFAHAIVDADEERRQAAGAAPGLRGISTVQSGVRTLAAVEAAFKAGAIATLGWPLDDPVVRPAGRASVPQDVQVVLELISGVDREAHVSQLEAVLKKDPTLAFRLMRYLNSPAFGLSVEINSFGHALMLLGYQRLKRWLALLLASSAKDINAKPVMFAAVRRGLLMEELGRGNGDAEMRGEMFICGVFSLLDRLLKQPFADLFKSVPVPDRVSQALLDESGPFHPFLELVRAIESESVFDIREWADQLFMTPAEVNRALLQALSAARALE
jgi:EAL and modified HD-GYP domain-containing signal transduction protein